MHKTIDDVIQALDSTSNFILSASNDNRNMMTVYGWNNAPLNRQDLANMTLLLSDQLKSANIEDLPENLNAELSTVPGKFTQLQNSGLLGYMFNGNGATAIPTFISTVNWLQTLVSPLLGWQTIDNPKSMPAQLARRVRSYHAEINELAPNKQELQNQIKLIHDATVAAETLPTDLEDLKNARERVETVLKESLEIHSRITSSMKEIESISNTASQQGVEIEKVVERSNQALRGATSVGLAGAFDRRAEDLNKSIYYWVAGLVLALVASIILGALRYEVLASKLNALNPNWGIISIHITLSILSLAAPVWFAWLSTKQIAQRFKLAEDYAFKASVAKAYEGYRTEALNIDEQFVSRLFGSALTRLEEAPLRLVGEEEHSSPLQELMASRGFQKAIESVPEFRDSFTKLFKDTVSKMLKTTAVIERQELEPIRATSDEDK